MFTQARPDLGSAAGSHHLQNVGARDARTTEPVAIHLANVSDLVTNRCDLADQRLKPLLWIRYSTETLTSILPCVCGEQEGWYLTEV